MLARQLVIGFGIAIVFPLLVYYGVCTFHAPPKSQDYFRNLEPMRSNETSEERKARLDQQNQRREAYDEAAKAFARVLIFVATPIGLTAMLIGSYLGFGSPVGTGLILGGILTVVHGYWTYWGHLEDWLRFASLLLGFLILLLVGYRPLGWRPAGRARGADNPI